MVPAAGGRSGVTLPYGSAAALALVRHSSEVRAGAGAAQGSVRIADSGPRRTRSSAPAGLPAHPALKDAAARRAGRADGSGLRVVFLNKSRKVLLV